MSSRIQNPSVSHDRSLDIATVSLVFQIGFVLVSLAPVWLSEAIYHAANILRPIWGKGLVGLEELQVFSFPFRDVSRITAPEDPAHAVTSTMWHWVSMVYSAFVLMYVLAVGLAELFVRLASRGHERARVYRTTVGVLVNDSLHTCWFMLVAVGYWSVLQALGLLLSWIDGQSGFVYLALLAVFFFVASAPLALVGPTVERIPTEHLVKCCFDRDLREEEVVRLRSTFDAGG